MLKTIKRGLLRKVEDVGLSDAVRDSRWRGRRLAILCYHGVSIEDEHEWNPALFVSQKLFAQRMEQLERGGYHVVSLHEGLERMYEGTLPPRSVAITFDDGNHDFFRRAFPVLRGYGFPATVYLTTYYCENNLPVFDVAARYVVWKGSDHLEAVESLLSSLGASSTPQRDPDELSSTIVHQAREAGWSTEVKHEFLGRLARTLCVDLERILDQRLLHIMEPDEVRAVAEAGIGIELHTHRHRTPLDPDLFRREIVDNSRRIEEMTGSRPRHFCYPNGYVRSEFLPWLEDMGVLSATTTEAGLASARKSPHLIPRIVDHRGLSPVEFEAWLSGAAAALPHRSPRAMAP